MNPIIAANWKMNLTIDEGLVLIDEVLNCSSPDDSEIIFFPTFIALGSVSNKLKNTGYGVGVQNIHHKESGAFTGEISAQMLQPLAVEFAKKYQLPIKKVVDCGDDQLPFTGDGPIINSSLLNGLYKNQAKSKIIEHFENKNVLLDPMYSRVFNTWVSHF